MALIRPFDRPFARPQSLQDETRREDLDGSVMRLATHHLEDFAMRIRTLALATAACVGLAACGTNPSDRAVTGGAMGAGAGLAIGAIAGAPLLGATIIGAGAGAIAGVITDPGKVNFGKPFWEQ
jgi:hypothetical protein